MNVWEKRLKAKRFFVLVLTLLLSINSTLVFIGSRTSANIVLNEDFSDLSDWNLIFGSWTASNGIIQGGNSSGAAVGWIGDKEWSNYIVTVNVRILSSSDEASVIVRYSDLDSYYLLSLGASGFKYSITKIESGVDTLLASFGSAGEIEVNRWYVLAAQVICGTLVMFVDGQEVLQVQDESLSAGAVGLVTWNGYMEAKDLIVQSLGWYKVYNNTQGGTHNELANDIIQTNDGGFAIAGQRRYYYGGNGPTRPTDSFLLLKTDANGNALWNYTYPAGAHSGASKIIGTIDGGFALLGHNYPSIIKIGDEYQELGETPMLIKTDSEGKQLWQQVYSPLNYSGGLWTPRILSSIVETGDGGYVMVGTIYSNLTSVSSMYDFWLVKTDSTGVMLWYKMYGNINYDEQGSTIIETSDGGLAFAGCTNSSGSKDFILIKTDSFGNVLWERTYGGMSDEVATSLIQLQDGGYALCGGNLFVRTDANGIVISEKTFNGNIKSMTETIDGNLFLNGNVFSGSWIAEISVTGEIKLTKTLPHFWSSTRFIQTVDLGYATVNAMSVGEGYFSDLGDITLVKFSSDFMEDPTGKIAAPETTATPTPTPTPSPSPSISPTPTASPTPSPSPSQILTATPTPSPTSTAAPTQSPTSTPTANPTLSPTTKPTGPPTPTTQPTSTPTVPELSTLIAITALIIAGSIAAIITLRKRKNIT